MHFWANSGVRKLDEAAGVPAWRDVDKADRERECRCWMGEKADEGVQATRAMMTAMLFRLTFMVSLKIIITRYLNESKVTRLARLRFLWHQCH